MSKILTKGELVAYLSGIRGATFATIETETEPKLLKTGNPYSEVRKISRVNVCLGFQYEAAVNRQRAREGAETDFEALPRKWGVRIPRTVLVEHKGKVYLETKVEKSLDHRYVNLQGIAIPDDLIAPFLPKRKENEHQDTEKEILVRDYSVDSIRRMNVKGEEFSVV